MIYETRIEPKGTFLSEISKTKTVEWIVSCIKQEYIEHMHVGDTITCAMNFHQKGHPDEDLTGCELVTGCIEQISYYLCTNEEHKDKYVKHVIICLDLDSTRKLMIDGFSEIEKKIKNKYGKQCN